MVMEFSDSAIDVDSNQMNSSHWKQFSEVRSFDVFISFLVTLKILSVLLLHGLFSNKKMLIWVYFLVFSIIPSLSSMT